MNNRISFQERLKARRLIVSVAFACISCAPIETRPHLASESDFTETAVQIPNARGLEPLKGFLAYRTDLNDMPATLILLGSGRGSTDDPARAYNPFATLAQKLARGTMHKKTVKSLRHEVLAQIS